MDFKIGAREYNIKLGLLFQTMLIKHEWPNFNIVERKNGINIYGNWKGKGYNHEYKFIISHTAYPYNVSAKFIQPYISPCPAIHVYPDSSLCLYHYREYQINKKFIISREIIPWILEWTVWYEIYIKNGGIWKGPEAPHG